MATKRSGPTSEVRIRLIEETTQVAGPDEAGERSPVDRREPGSYRGRYDRTEVSPSVAVIDAIGTLEESAPVEIPPLHGAIDPDALDRLVSSVGDADSGALTITFSHADYEITVENS